MAKLRKRRAMIDPKEFDAPTIGGVVNKAKDTVSDTVENISNEADFAKKRFDIDMDPNKPKATDFDQNPPKKIIKEPLKEKLKREFDKPPIYTDTSASKNYDTRSDADKYFDQEAFRDSNYKPTPDNKSLALTYPGRSGSGSSSSGSGSGSGGSGSGSGTGSTISVPVTVIPSSSTGSTISVPVTVIPKSGNTSEPKIDKKDKRMSDTESDRLAMLGGYNTSIKVLRRKRDDIDKELNRLNATEETDLKERRAAESVIREYNDIVEQIQKIDYWKLHSHGRDIPLPPAEQKRYDDLTSKRDSLKEKATYYSNFIKYGGVSGGREDAMRMHKIRNLLEQREENYKEFSEYDLAVSRGLEIDKGNWRKEAASISDATQNLLGKPIINDISQQVGYGGMTGRSAVEGINAITGGYKVKDDANSWTRTNVGDRQLVESLVNIRPNRVITPFGVPGTVGESNLSQQFQYSSPLRKIGVGDVTARGGYQINIEDIHRKRGDSQPAIVRKKLMQKKLAKQKKLIEHQKLVEKRKLAEKKMFVTSKNVIKTSMIIQNPGVAKAISFVGKIQSPMVGGVRDIKGLNNNLIKGSSTLEKSSTLGKSSGLTVGNNTITMKGIKAFASMSVITNMKKKKVSK